MLLHIYTLIHVAISLIGIASGFVVIFGMLKGRRLDGWTKLFLVTTVTTSVSGFGFPIEHLTPGHIIGVLSLIVLAAAILGRYAYHLTGAWRWIYVIGAVVAQHLNVFVLIVQSFQKVPALKALAPTQAEPPFAITQLVVLLIFVALGVLAVRRFHPQSVQTRIRPA